MYTCPSNKASKYTKQKLTELKGSIDKSTIMVRNVKTFFSVLDRKLTQKNSVGSGRSEHCVYLIFTEHYAQQLQNTHYLQMYMEHTR